MKPNLKLVAVLLCFYFSASTASAQKADTSKASFVGIWELYQSAANGQPLRNYPPGYIKIYNADGTFTVIQGRNTGSIIKGKGYYAVDNNETCREADKAEDLPTKGFKINYEFSTDKKVLTIGFSYPDGSAFTEAYRKL